MKPVQNLTYSGNLITPLLFAWTLWPRLFHLITQRNKGPGGANGRLESDCVNEEAGLATVTEHCTAGVS